MKGSHLGRRLARLADQVLELFRAGPGLVRLLRPELFAAEGVEPDALLRLHLDAQQLGLAGLEPFPGYRRQACQLALEIVAVVLGLVVVLDEKGSRSLGGSCMSLSPAGLGPGSHLERVLVREKRAGRAAVKALGADLSSHL